MQAEVLQAVVTEHRELTVRAGRAGLCSDCAGGHISSEVLKFSLYSPKAHFTVRWFAEKRFFNVYKFSTTQCR